MRFFHHGLPLVLDDERIILPTPTEAADGIEALSIIVGWCQHPDCGKRFVYMRYKVDGSYGLFRRLKSGDSIKTIISRLKMAKESDWVWGHSNDGHGRKVKVPVR